MSQNGGLSGDSAQRVSLTLFRDGRLHPPGLKFGYPRVMAWWVVHRASAWGALMLEQLRDLQTQLITHPELVERIMGHPELFPPAPGEPERLIRCSPGTAERAACWVMAVAA